jgi:hypothetical protein
MQIHFYEAQYDSRVFRAEGIYPEGMYLFISAIDGWRHNLWEYDYLQDDLDMCKSFALEYFGVPYELWHQLPDDTLSLL